MYSAFRPAARRLITIKSNVSFLAVTKSRSITTQSIAYSARPAAAVSTPLRIQRRWNSDEANKKVVENVEPESELKSEAQAEVQEEAAVLESAVNSVSEGAATTTTTTTSTTSTTAAEDNVSSDSLDPEVSAEQIAEAAAEAPRSPFNLLDTSSADINQRASHKERGYINRTNLAPKETLYVANLFFDVSAADLKARFEAFGTVTNCTIVHDNRGLSKGFGYVTFETIEQATRAVEAMNQTVYEGRRILVQYSAAATRPPRPKTLQLKEPSRCLYIGNLSFNMTDRELNDLFKSVRNVVEVRVAVDRQTGQPRGFAHADFIDVESAQAASEILASKAPHGRRLRIDYSARSTRRSPAQTINDEVTAEEPKE